MDPAGVASVAETAAVAAVVGLPFLARGPIVRRRRVLGALARVDADRTGIALLQKLRRRHGPGPLRLRVPGRSVAIVLSAADARRVLDESPGVFAVASREKRAALDHFQPTGVIVSDGPLRAPRRAAVEQVLDTGCPVHRGDGVAERVAAVVADEAPRLLALGERTHADLEPAWWRIVRRVTFGDAATHAHDVTDALTALRRRANWAYLRTRDDAARQRVRRRLDDLVARAEPGTLGALLARLPDDVTDPVGQAPHWLFAFDAAGIAITQTLALLAAHPEHEERALAGGDAHVRACVLDALRLWPTTPAILRDTTEATTLGGVALPAGSTVVVHAPLLHRDDETVPFADAFDPGVWLDRADGGNRGSVARRHALVPFSDGPARYPGREYVLLVTAAVVSRVLVERRVRLRSPRLVPGRLPRTLSPFGVRLHVTAREQ